MRKEAYSCLSSLVPRLCLAGQSGDPSVLMGSVMRKGCTEAYHDLCKYPFCVFVYGEGKY